MDCLPQITKPYQTQNAGQMYHGSQTAGAKVRRREGKSPDQQLRPPNPCSVVKVVTL